MPPQGSTTPRARHAAPARHGRSGGTGRGRRPGRGGRAGRGLGRAGILALVVLAVLLVGGGGAAIAMMAVGTSGDTTAAPGAAAVTARPAAGTEADAGLPMSPTMLASISSVPSGDEVVVDVAGRSIPVHILGIVAPAAGECGAEASLAFANEQMSGQMVTLVPDPTMPEMDPQGRRLAYVVLRTQLSYTDAALMKGMARADTTRPLWYSDVFVREQAKAVDDEQGIWGDPCRAKP